MKKLPLKSKFGCLRCRHRRRKCDEVKPTCGECLRFGVPCCWLPAANTKNVTSSTNQRATAIVHDPKVSVTNEKATQLTSLPSYRSERSEHQRLPRFDHPAILQASTTSVVQNIEDKHALGFLCERGHSILRYPTRLFAAHTNMNIWRSGFPMASTSPIQVEAYLCLAAGYLSSMNAEYYKLSLKHYINVTLAFRSELERCERDGPAEWLCAVAAILAWHEMTVFYSARNRLAHLVGFHRIVEARLQKGLPWSPLKILLEQYLHSLAINSLFHFEEVVGTSPISHMDELMSVLNAGSRPVGLEIVGVPEELTLVVYRLSILNFENILKAPWDFEMLATEAMLNRWRPSPHSSTPAGAVLLLIGKIYQLACTCLIYNIKDRHTDARSSKIAPLLEEARTLIQQSDLHEQPLNSALWPLTILGIFAIEQLQRDVFTRPIKTFVTKIKVKGYQTVLEFLAYVWAEDLGSEVLQRRDLLKMVYI